MQKNKLVITYTAIFFIAAVYLIFYNTRACGISGVLESGIKNRGVWVTSFSQKRVLYSREAVYELIKFCKAQALNEIYLQFYRQDQAYYDSTITDRSRYEDIIKNAGMDTLRLLIKEARKNNIKIFAWVNVLNIAQNKKANVIIKFGKSILTRDQHLRVSMRGEDQNESDKYYLRDEQLFLEPGDPLVVDYMTSIIMEIVAKYRAISGVHLDYVRYPYIVPFVPRSSFNKFGLTYGYGEKNIERFKDKYGTDPLAMADENDNFLNWDNWKRVQVTNLVERVSKNIKNKSRHLLVSCAVIPSAETAYSTAFQDWPLWLERGVVDYVVLMNYTRNNQLTREVVRSALSHRAHRKIFIGIGAFMMKDDPALLFEQYNIIEKFRPDGVIFFSYDEMDKIFK